MFVELALLALADVVVNTAEQASQAYEASADEHAEEAFLKVVQNSFENNNIAMLMGLSAWEGVVKATIELLSADDC
jgi:hypothetical protein